MPELMSLGNTILSTAMRMDWVIVLSALAFINFWKARRTWLSSAMLIAALFIAFGYVRGLGMLG